jgi:hypothetical protein
MRSGMLAEAHDKVHAERNAVYGHPVENHSTTAIMWSSYLGIRITPEQVCMMNVLQKVSRTKNTFTEDTLQDIAGYAENAHIIMEEKGDFGPVIQER